MYYLIYSSRSINSWDDPDLLNLLRVSSLNNRSRGITGLLLYVKDRFVQLLEGEKEKVLALYQTIGEDTRHAHVNTLLSGVHNEGQRLFPDWSMAFRKLSFGEFKDISGYRDLEALFVNEELDDMSHPALVFMKHFTQRALKDTAITMEPGV